MEYIIAAYSLILGTGALLTMLFIVWFEHDTARQHINKGK